MGIGDEIMATAEAKRRQRSDARPVAFRGKDGRPRWHPIFDNNPRISKKFEGAQISDNRSGNRPYIALVTSKQFFWVPKFDCEPGEIFFTQSERQFAERHAGMLVIEPHVKNRDGNNKAWPWERWQAVVNARKSLPWAQTGLPGTRTLDGVRLIPTPDFRQAAAVLSTSLGYVGCEGGMHHAAAAVGKPAVVLFGGFVSPAQTGYSSHFNLFTGGKACGMRTPCKHCIAAMGAISVQNVLEGIKQMKMGEAQ